MIEPKILWKGTLPNADIQVTFIDTSHSNREIDPQIEDKLASKWRRDLAEARKTNTLLYDGISYRLESLTSDPSHLSLCVSPIRFSVRSTLKEMPELEERGEAYYSNGLAVGGFVVTNDGKYVFGKKSARSASSLRVDIIGGVLEKIEPPTGEGILNMNKQELEEELNLSPELIREMRILGLVRLSSTDIVVLTRTVLTVSTIELQKIFDARQERELDSIEYVEPIGLRRYLKKLGGYKPIIGKLLIGE